MYIFKKEDVIVESWVNCIIRGDIIFEKVPNYSNLKTIVEEVLKEVGFEEEVKPQ